MEEDTTSSSSPPVGGGGGVAGGPSASPAGRVVRVHLACRAHLPMGSSLRVTSAHLWDPAETGSPADPSGARRVTTLVGRDAFRSGDSGFAGGSLGMGASNVVNEDEAAVTGEGTVTPVGGHLKEPGSPGSRVEEEAEVEAKAGAKTGDGHGGGGAAPSAGIRDPQSHWYASSVEMVTCPDTYPLWRTRKPVVLVLADPDEKGGDGGGGDGMDADDKGSTSGSTSAAVFHHRYRYLVVTPGAEAEHSSSRGGPGGLLAGHRHSDTSMEGSIRTKISDSNLFGMMSDHDIGGSASTSADDSGDSFPVTLWENPFVEEEEARTRGALGRESSGQSSTGMLSAYSSAGALSTYSVAGGGGGAALTRDYDLANLPYRTLDIDVANGRVAKPQPFSSSEHMDEDSLEYTEGGVLIDSWNNRDDVTFKPYRVREGIGGQKAGDSCEEGGAGEEEANDEEMASATSMSTEEGGLMAIEPENPRRIFIVCYHLPVTVSKDPDTGQWQATWAESLLAKTPNSSFASTFDPQWVGTVTTAAGSPIVDGADREALRSLLATMGCTVLFIDDAVRDMHYKGFCKQVLWLAFHHVDLFDMRNPAFSMDLDATPDNKVAKDGTLFDLRSMYDQRQVLRWWEAYNAVNQAFAVEVAKMVQPEDVVWVHDYHLSLLPRMLGDEERRLHPSATRPTKKIFFLHIPFPVSMIFKEIDCGAAILEGILHADVVGFHGFTEARHFLSSAKRILGVSHESFEGGLIGVKYRRRTVVVTMSSVSIEPSMVDAVMQLPTSINGEAELRSKHAGRAIIAGLDVAQYLSGVGLKLIAYEKLLDDAPLWRGKLVLVQRCLIPGARKLDEARTIQGIRTIVKRIISKYGEAAIDYGEVFGSTLPVDQRLALWKASDCLLNTEIRGGLNLWPLEYVYAQKDSNCPGTVILSEFSAVFGILNGAQRINPFDLELTLGTIDKALTLSAGERVGRHLRDIDFVSSSSSAQWIENVLRDLRDQTIDDLKNAERRDASSSEGQSVAEFLTSERDDHFTRLDPKSVLSAYNSSSKRVIILDFNGTIVIKEAVDSFLKRDAIGSAGDAPPQAVYWSLAKLCADPQNTVFVVSGDGKENMEKAIGNIPVGLAASNGSCFSPPPRSGSSERTWLALDLGIDWNAVKRVAIPIMSKFTARTNGSFIKLAHSSIGWSYYSCDPEFGSLQAKYLVMELERDLAGYDVRFVHLKGVVEVIPRRLNKGIIVKKILRDVAARDGNAGLDFILCMGDDISDEKMFTSVFSFISEMDEDYINVHPSPPVIQLSEGTLPASHSFLAEPESVRCRDLSAPMFAYTVAVGKKESHASQFVDDAEDVADLLMKLAMGSADARFEREKEGERQLKRFSAIVRPIPLE